MYIVNGVTNWKYDAFPGMMEMAHTHFLISEEQYQQLKDPDCNYGFAMDMYGILDLLMSQPTKCAENLLEFLKVFAGEDHKGQINIYDMYADCYHEDVSSQTDLLGLTMVGGHLKGYKKYSTFEDMTPWLSLKGLQQKMRSKSGDILNLSEDNGQPVCTYGRPLTEYLNRGDVRKALHIPDDIQAWENCNLDIAKDYTKAGDDEKTGS